MSPETRVADAPQALNSPRAPSCSGVLTLSLRFQVMPRCPVSGCPSVRGRGAQVQPGPALPNPDSKALWLQLPVGRRLLGQGRGGTGAASPSGLPPSRAGCCSAGMPGTKLEAGVGCWGRPAAPPPPFLSCLSSHCPGEFSMCSWLGQELRGLGLGLLGRSAPSEVKCPFGGGIEMGVPKVGERRRGGQKARTAPCPPAPTKCGSRLVPLRPEAPCWATTPTGSVGPVNSRQKNPTFCVLTGFRSERNNEGGDIPFLEGQEQKGRLRLGEGSQPGSELGC